DGLRLRVGEEARRPSLRGQVVEGDTVQAVAGRADLLIDLEAALERRTVEHAEGALERKGLGLRRKRLAHVVGLRNGRTCKAQEGNEGERESFHYRFSPTRPGSGRVVRCWRAAALGSR